MKRYTLGAIRREAVLGMGAFCLLLIALLWLGFNANHEAPSSPRAPAPEASAEDPRRPRGSEWQDGTLYIDQATSAESLAATTLWIYLPPGKHAAASLPAIFIAPDGTNGLIGAALDETQQAEHLPWLRDGFAVVAYSLAGAMTDNTSDEETLVAARAFRDAHGGLDDAQRALAYALARFPELDPKHLYLVGHGSAGTVALNVAATDSHFAACVAIDPIINVETYSSPGIMTVLEQILPGTRAFAQGISPATTADKIKCPVLISHADDDDKVPAADAQGLTNAINRSAGHATLVQRQKLAATDAELQQTIAQGIAWVKALDGKK